MLCFARRRRRIRSAATILDSNNQQLTIKTMDNKETSMVELTTEEQELLEQLRKDRAAKEAAEKTRADREAYKQLTEELVARHLPQLQALNRQMLEVKRAIYEEAAMLIKTKGELYQVKPGQRSHSWRDASGNMRLTLGYHVRDAWDDTVEEGIAKVKQYINSLGNNDETKALVEIILDLLAKDAQGNLQADKVLQLDKYTDKIDNELFSDGVQIIKDAYHTETSKQYIRAEVKDANNAWRNIPLSITEVGDIPMLEQIQTDNSN